MESSTEISNIQQSISLFINTLHPAELGQDSASARDRLLQVTFYVNIKHNCSFLLLELNIKDNSSYLLLELNLVLVIASLILILSVLFCKKSSNDEVRDNMRAWFIDMSEEFHQLQYLSDNFTDTVWQLNDIMTNASHEFESLFSR